MLRFKIVGIGRRPMLIQGGADLLLLDGLLWLRLAPMKISFAQLPCSARLAFGIKPGIPVVTTGFNLVLV